jgi:hypothetical protein
VFQLQPKTFRYTFHIFTLTRNISITQSGLNTDH